MGGHNTKEVAGRGYAGGLFLALVGISVLDVEKGDLAEDVMPEEGHTLKVEPSTHGGGDTPDGEGGEASQREEEKDWCQSSYKSAMKVYPANRMMIRLHL